MATVSTVAKYAPPHLPREVIRRSRLLSQLHGNVDRKLTILAAGAGYGKTTLAAHFAEEVDFPVAWIAVSPWNKAPLDFLESVVLALQSRFPRFGHSFQAMLRAVDDFEKNLASISHAFLQELDCHIDDYLLLVIDDYHQLEEDHLTGSLFSELIPHLPENVHIFITSRTRPNLACLPRLLANREAKLFSPKELRFNDEEAGELFEALQEKPPAGQELRTINERCEGWPAALILAAQGEFHNLTPNSEGQLLIEYLEEELFQELEDSLKHFLVHTSVLPIMLPQICDRLAGVNDSQEALHRLYEKNLVTEEQRSDLIYYRYHALLREFLYQKLRAQRGDGIKSFGASAGALLEKADLWQEALDVYCETGAFESAVTLLSALVEELSARDEWNLIGQALDRLPGAVLYSNEELTIRRAEAYALQGRPDDTLNLLERADLSDIESLSSPLRERALLAKAIAFRNKGQLSESESCCLDALDLMSGSSHRSLLFARAHHNLGMAFLDRREFRAATRHLSWALQGYERIGNDKLSAQVYNQLGIIADLEGNLGTAIGHYNQALRRFRESGSEWGVLMALNNIGNSFFLMAEYDTAKELLEESAALASSLGLSRDEAYAVVSIADIYRACDNSDEAAANYSKGEELARKCQEMRLLAYVLDGKAQNSVRQGRLASAEAFVEEGLKIAGDHQLGLEKGILLVTRAIVQREYGRNDKAVEYLHDALSLLDDTDSPLESSRAHLQLAYTHMLASKESMAARELKAVNDILYRLSSPFFLIPDLLYTEGLLEFAENMDERNEIYSVLRKKVEAMRSAIEVPATQEPGKQEEKKSIASPSETLRAESLGGARVFVNDQEIKSSQWRSAKAKELFFLLAHLSRPLRREEIIEALWPDVLPEKGESAFKSNLFRARQALNPEWFVYDDGCYRFEPGGGEFYLDALEFLRLLEIADHLPESADLRLRYIEEAVSLYKGSFLPNFYSNWCESERSRLESRYIQSLSTLSGHYLTEERYEIATSTSQRILEIDPYNEEALYQTILSLARSGNRAAALHYYRQYRELLEQELGIEPSKRVQELYDSLTNRPLN